ncbi:MAG: hypothetical protein IJI14_04070 [Anaerolineaceae bacterium]|nr:hypothetical protein [Anaerolineaceae bacterium]
MAEGNELAFVIGGLFLSLSAFSLVFGDNYLFRLGAAILSGAISAYICVLITENYFYPLILEIVDGYKTLNTLQIIRTVLTVLGILLLFCKAYTGNKSGGKIIMTVVLALCAAVLVLGAAGASIPAFVQTLAAQFRISAISPEQRNNVWYWIKAGTVLFSAFTALLFTRHYSLPGKMKKEKTSESVLGNIVIGFSFGAVAAAVFLTAANILVNHISGMVMTIQSLVK